MSESKKEVLDSIVIIANHLNLPSYSNLITSIGYTLPELVKMIVYDMFLKGFSNETAWRMSSNDELLKAFATVEYYARELQENGFVEFNQK